MTYYAAFKGKAPGVYSKRGGEGGAEEQVKKFPGAVHKSFASKERAEQFVNRGRLQPNEKRVSGKEKEKRNRESSRNEGGPKNENKGEKKQEQRQGEQHLKERLQQLLRLRSEAARPPAVEPADRSNVKASIVTREWRAANGIAVPED